MRFINKDFIDRYPGSRDYLDGMTALAPFLLGAIPFGVIAGVVAAKIGMSPAPGISQSAIVYAGAAQLAMAQLMTYKSSLAVIVATGLIVNLRLAMYSASLAPHFAGLPSWKRALIAYLLTDQSYAVCVLRFTTGAPMSLASRMRYYIGGGIMTWFAWMAAVTCGFVLGAGIPESWSLAFIAPLSFLTLLVPSIRDRATLAAAIAGAGTAIAASNLPLNLGLFLGAVAGIVTGFVTETRQQRRKAEETP